MRIRDYTRGSNGEGEAVRAFIVSNRDAGDMSIVTDSVLNFPNKFIATTGDLDEATGLISQESATVMFCHLDGSIIMIDEFAPGYPDVGNTANQVMVLKPTTAWSDAVSDSLGELITSSPTPPDDPRDGDLWLDESDLTGLRGVDLDSSQTITHKTIDGILNTLTNISPSSLAIQPLSTSGKNGAYVQLGTLLVCYGTDAVLNSGTTINFGKAFAALPTVVATVRDTNNQTAWVTPSVTTTSMVLKQIFTNNALSVGWIAIGTAA